ncbi:MAG TPA: tetratricopeptide repeat protein [Roseomonas sp.]|jgi:tetratricopeptide (TPR) repeat protein
MRRALLFLLFASPAALAQAPAAPPSTADSRRQELDRLFEALRDAPDEASGALVEARIRALWQENVTAAVGLLVRRGLRNMQANAPEEALEDFDAAITLEPGTAELWTLRAQAYAAGGDREAAARDLREALRLEPRHFPALITLSQLQEERGDAAAALRSFQAVLALHPKLRGGEQRLRELRRKAEGDVT